MEHNYKSISDIGTVITGKTPSTDVEEYFDGEFPFITPSDIHTYDEKYLLSTERTLSIAGAQVLKGNKLPEDSICFVCIGSTIGKMCKTNQVSYTNQQINSIIPKSMYDSDYIFYYLRYVKNYFQSVGGGTGSGKGIVNKTLFSKTKLDIIEDIKSQREVASILSTYDSLIEANNKRIKILEQMAENLYKEWFVRFRFPGHETAEFENGLPKGWALSSECKPIIPKGWHYGEFGELGKFVRGKNITSAEMIEGEIPVISAGLEPSGFHNEANVHGRSLTISASGANAGYMKYNLDDIWAADCSYYQSEKHLWFAFSTLKFLQPVISNLQCGAAQPHVHPKQINRLTVIIPTDKMIRKYCDVVEPMFCEIKTLAKQNENLSKQRDLLLPRLMSGKLEV